MPQGLKGTVKKSGAAQRPRSRNQTPRPPPADESAYLDIPLAPIQNATYDELIMPTPGSVIPNTAAIDVLIERAKGLLNSVKQRGIFADRAMRELARMRDSRAREMEQESYEEEKRERARIDEEEERGRTASKMKKRKDGNRGVEDWPLAHGAHGAHAVAAQDGSSLLAAFETSSTSPTASTSRKAQRQVSGEADSASSSLSPVEEQNTPVHADIMDTVTDDGVVDHAVAEERQPPKTLPEGVRSRPFGDDPSTFPDPTIYELCKITPGMSEGEIKEICSVAGYPRNDLHDLIPGTPPDKDFSNAKPSNQVQASTFASYLEPYFRPYTEEDLAFLREKGDRVTPFVIPPRGKKHYSEIWSEEDGAMSIDGEKRDRDKLPANQARGSIEDMNDDTAETDQISCAPVLTRMLALMRPERRTPASENNNGVGGESNTAGEANNDLGGAGGFAMDEPTAPLPPAAYMPESGTDQWKKGPGPNLEPTQVDQRLLAELRHIGFIGADEEPQYDGHFDDEVAARLRYLQAQLKETVIMNTARKARLMELVTPEMAHQEYKTIQDDLDSQVQSAFMKRSRSIGKKKNTKRPGGAGGGSHAVSTASGMARPGIGDVTKTLLERREKWMLSVGPVFQDDPQLGKVPRLSDTNSSIYKPQDMAAHIRRAREAWDEEADEDEE